MHGPRLLRESGQSLFDPLGGLRIAAEMTQAFWRLWGLMPAPRRPGEKEGGGASEALMKSWPRPRGFSKQGPP